MIEQDRLIERERYDARAQSKMAGAVVYYGFAINLERLAEK